MENKHLNLSKYSHSNEKKKKIFKKERNYQHFEESNFCSKKILLYILSKLDGWKQKYSSHHLLLLHRRIYGPLKVFHNCIINTSLCFGRFHSSLFFSLLLNTFYGLLAGSILVHKFGTCEMFGIFCSFLFQCIHIILSI